MRLDQPRLEPLPSEEWSEDTRQIVTPTAVDGVVLNIFSTLAHHPQLLRRWLVFFEHVLFESSLPPRERQIVILRIGWLCKAEYQWAQHVLLGAERGLTVEEMERIKRGPEAPGWGERDALLLQATDELHQDALISDATWKGLSLHLSVNQRIDLVFTVGQYNMVSMVVNTLGVQLEEGVRGF